MPSTTMRHAPDCASYSVASSLGLQQLRDENTVIMDETTGKIYVDIQFILTKHLVERTKAVPQQENPTSAVKGKSGFTLQSLLQFLWHNAGLCVSPTLNGTVTWDDVKKYLIDASGHMMTKGFELTERLYIPVSAQSGYEKYVKLSATTRIDGGIAQVGIMIDLLDTVWMTETQGEYGKLKTRNNPHVMCIDKKTHKKLQTHYDKYKSTWESCNETMNVVVIATYVRKEEVFSVLEFALMSITKEWLPCANTLEKKMIEKLTSDSRHFDKCLRFNLPASRPVPSAVLSDTTTPRVELYVWPEEGFCATYESELRAILRKSPAATWCWREKNDPELPPLPPCC